MEAMLSATGEVGYARVTVKSVLDRHGGSRAQFYKYFANAAACYEAAYAAESERLCEALLAAGRKGDSWRVGLEAALTELARFAYEQPMRAKGLLVGVHLAGEPTLRKRKEVFERLSRAIDSARREIQSRHSPPPLTAVFIIHVIDAAMVNALTWEAPERFSPSELADLVAVYYDIP